MQEIITAVVGLLLILAVLFTWVNVSGMYSLAKKRAKEERDAEFAINRQLKRITEVLEAISGQ